MIRNRWKEKWKNLPAGEQAELVEAGLPVPNDHQVPLVCLSADLLIVHNYRKDILEHRQVYRRPYLK